MKGQNRIRKTGNGDKGAIKPQVLVYTLKGRKPPSSSQDYDRKLKKPSLPADGKAVFGGFQLESGGKRVDLENAGW